MDPTLFADYSNPNTFLGTWDGIISDGAGGVTTNPGALDSFSSGVNSAISLLGGLGKLQSAAQNQSTAQYVAKANADATRAAANAQVAAAQKPISTFNVNTLMIWIAVAGLVFAAMQVVGKK